MPRALLLIVSNTLSGTGLGLLAWLGVTMALLHGRGSTMVALQGLYAWGLGLGVLLVVAGAWAAHATRVVDGAGADPAPGTQRWRQWRSSWRARCDVATAATVLIALLVGALLAVARGPTSATLLGMLAIVLAIAAIAAATSGAMALSGQVQVTAWRHQLVLPLQMLGTMLGGLALLFATMSLVLPGNDGLLGMLGTLAWMGLLLVAGSAAWWFAIDRSAGQRASAAQPAVTAQAAPGLVDSFGTRLAAAAQRPRTPRLVTAVLLLGAPLLALGLVATGAASGAALLVPSAIAIILGIALWQALLHAQAPDAALASA